MADREARQRAIKQAAERVRSSDNPFLRRTVAERTPTDVLVERAREVATRAQLPWDSDLLTALADRLAELAALEPVLELLAVMRERPKPRLMLQRDPISITWVGGISLDGDVELWEQEATAEAALAALAAAVLEGGA